MQPQSREHWDGTLPLVAIVGPTATGKTALTVFPQLAGAS